MLTFVLTTVHSSDTPLSLSSSFVMRVMYGKKNR